MNNLIRFLAVLAIIACMATLVMILPEDDRHMVQGIASALVTGCAPATHCPYGD